MSSADGYTEKPEELDELFAMLSDHGRRELIIYFESATPKESALLDEVATHIDSQVPLSNQAEIQNSLQHIHLPKLMENAWVDYDGRTGEIRYHGHDYAAQLLTEITAVFED